MSTGHRTGSTRRPFTPEEDVKLIDIMRAFQFTNWDTVSKQMGTRTARQCRERWVNYLSPTIRTEPWSEMEDNLLVEKVNELGRSWSSIGRFFNGRSENDVKNRWYSHLRFQTIEGADGKLVFVTDPAQAPFPERKKRNRTKVSPKQNALHMIGQRQRRMQAAQPLPIVLPQVFPTSFAPVMPIVEPIVRQAEPSPPLFSDVIDSWDRGFDDVMTFEDADGCGEGGIHSEWMFI